MGGSIRMSGGVDHDLNGLVSVNDLNSPIGPFTRTTRVPTVEG